MFSGTPWSYSFETADPTQWTYGDFEYTASFGPGGIFQMTGPDNLTFTGQITSGAEHQYAESYSGEFSFSGQWSNSMYGSGFVTLTGLPDNHYYATLDAHTVPESATLAMFASGIVGLWGVCRRRLRI
jgi:hypothetical protein